MNWLLSLIGAIPGALNGLFTWLNKKEDTTLGKYTIDGNVNIAAMQQDTLIIQARAQLAAAMKDDPATKMARRLLMYPVCLWFALIVFDSVFRENEYIGPYTWRVLALPGNLSYLPYAVVAYLLVTSFKK